LWLYLQNRTKLISDTTTNIKLLHFAAERGIYDKFISLPHIDYYPVDFNPLKRRIRDVVDIQHIQYESNMFDALICSHVLEHIPDDRKAISELYRVLKPGGTAYILVPISHKLEATLENPEYDTPELRTEHYGQFDHVRRYGKDFIPTATRISKI